MSDAITAWLRTIVPTVWSAALAWLILRIPALAPVADQLGMLGDLVLVPLVLAAWKSLGSAVEAYLPPWLTRLLLGSNKTPTYTPLTATSAWRPGGTVPPAA